MPWLHMALVVDKDRDATVDTQHADHTLHPGFCQCPLPPQTIRSRAGRWQTPGRGYSHPMERGKHLVWDATSPDTFAPSYLQSVTNAAGAVAALAENRKKD